MRYLFALTMFAFACGGSSPKKETSIVPAGDVPTECCCKTIPTTDEKEIQPVYAMSGRMECSTNQGECVDNVQCSGDQNGSSSGDTSTSTSTSTSTTE